MKTTVRTGIYIDRPPEAVAQVVLDPTKAVLWTSGLVRFEVVSGRPGEVGSTAHLHYCEKGQPYVMEDVLLEAVPNRRYVSRVSGDALTAKIETFLTPSNGGTRVVVRWTGVGRRLLFRLLLPFMRRTITRQAHADLTNLKDLVEGSPERGGPIKRLQTMHQSFVRSCRGAAGLRLVLTQLWREAVRRSPSRPA